jgi:hypothetical protein
MTRYSEPVTMPRKPPSYLKLYMVPARANADSVIVTDV